MPVALSTTTGAYSAVPATSSQKVTHNGNRRGANQGLPRAFAKKPRMRNGKRSDAIRGGYEGMIRQLRVLVQAVGG
jgi:hypothetical protein